MTTQTIQIHTFDYGASLSSATLRSIADDTLAATADSVNEVTTDSGLYAVVFGEASVIAAGDYRLRAVISGQPINRYVTLAGTDNEVVQARSERHAVLDTAYLFDDGLGHKSLNANVTNYQGTFQGNGNLPAKLDSIQTDVDGANNYLSAIVYRIGAFTGTGVNTILGFFKSLMSKTASTPSDVGGTFDPAADSTEAIRDRGDAAWTTGAGGGGGDNTEVLEAIDSMKSLISEWIALNIPSDVRGFPATIIGGTDIGISLEIVDSSNDPITEIFGESVEAVEWLFGMGTSARRARILGAVEWDSDLLQITIDRADTIAEDDGPRTWMIGVKLTSGEIKWVKTGVTRLIGRQFAEPTTTTTGA